MWLERTANNTQILAESTIALRLLRPVRDLLNAVQSLGELHVSRVELFVELHWF